MEDLVCYEIILFDDKDSKVLYCIGKSEKDIVDSIIEWAPRIKTMKYIGEGYVAREAAKYANE
jgi:hypothetical protein